MLRPVTCIKYFKDSGFLVLDFDVAARGVGDLKFVIE